MSLARVTCETCYGKIYSYHDMNKEAATINFNIILRATMTICNREK